MRVSSFIIFIIFIVLSGCTMPLTHQLSYMGTETITATDLHTNRVCVTTETATWAYPVSYTLAPFALLLDMFYSLTFEIPSATIESIRYKFFKPEE